MLNNTIQHGDIFGFSPKKLLCIWHVEQAWKNIQIHIKGAKNKVKVYHMLHVLCAETNPIDFQLLLSQAISYFYSNFEDFYDYMCIRRLIMSNKHHSGQHAIQKVLRTNMFPRSIS